MAISDKKKAPFVKVTDVPLQPEEPLNPKTPFSAYVYQLGDASAAEH